MPLGCRWKDNITIVLEETEWGMVSCRSCLCPVGAGGGGCCFEFNNEPSVYIKDRKFLNNKGDF
jgi:hypothetical protein